MKQNKKEGISKEEKEKLIQTVNRVCPISVKKEQREAIIAVYEKHRDLFRELGK